MALRADDGEMDGEFDADAAPQRPLPAAPAANAEFAIRPTPTPPAGAPRDRGLDSGLAFMCPTFANEFEKYKEFRSRGKLFELACRRRGDTTTLEGVVLLVSKLTDKSWDSLEDVIELGFDDAATAFSLVWNRLDSLFKYDKRVEQPQLFDTFVHEFCRSRGETLSAYKIRLEQLERRMRANDVQLPEELIGWLFLERAAVPEWQIPVVKANVGNNLRVDPLFETLKLMFGADSMPHARDLARVRNKLSSANRSATSRADAHWAEDDDADYYDDEEEGYWEEGGVRRGRVQPGGRRVPGRASGG